MKNDIKTTWLLNIVNLIMNYGEKENYDYSYMGVNLLTSHDGYTLELSDANCNLHLSFHHKYRLDYPNQKALEIFLNKLTAIENSVKKA